MERKRLATLPLFFSCGAIFLIGCGRQPEGPVAASAFASQIVIVSCPDQRTAAAIRVASKGWEGRNEARVEVKIYDPKKGPDDIKADLWVIAPAELPRWAAADRLVELPSRYLTRGAVYDWDGLIPLYRDHLLSWGDAGGTALRPWAMPILGEAPVCCYRLDAFKNRAPETWKDLVDIAQNGLFALRLAPLPTDGEALEREFLSIAANYARRAITDNEIRKPDQDDQTFSFLYDRQTGQPRIADPGFVHALRVLRQLRPYRPEPAAEPELAFLKGDAIFCCTNARWVARFQSDPDSKVRDRFGVCVMPGAERLFAPDDALGRAVSPPNRVPYLGSGGWLGVVPKKNGKDPGNTDAAFDLLADLSGKETSWQLVQEPRIGGGPVRQSQLADDTRWSAFELDRPRTAALRYTLRQTLLHPNVRNPAMRLRTPDERSHHEALVAGLRDALKNDADPKKVLEAVADEWIKLDKEHGKAKHLAEYRQSLGLPPAE